VFYVQVVFGWFGCHN